MLLLGVVLNSIRAKTLINSLMTARLSKSSRIEFTYDVNSSKNMAYLVSTESSEKNAAKISAE